MKSFMVKNKPSASKRLAYRIRCFEVFKDKTRLSLQENAWVASLKKDGYLIIEDFVRPAILQKMQKELQETLYSLDKVLFKYVLYLIKLSFNNKLVML
jgi:hypothetical protein